MLSWFRCTFLFSLDTSSPSRRCWLNAKLVQLRRLAAGRTGPLGRYQRLWRLESLHAAKYAVLTKQTGGKWYFEFPDDAHGAIAFT